MSMYGRRAGKKMLPTRCTDQSLLLFHGKAQADNQEMSSAQKARAMGLFFRSCFCSSIVVSLPKPPTAAALIILLPKGHSSFSSGFCLLLHATRDK